MRARIWEMMFVRCASFATKIQVPAYLGDRVEGQRNGTIWRGACAILATEEELEARSTGAVRDTDCAGELDEVGSSDTGVRSDEALLESYDLVCPSIRWKLRFNIAESNEGSVGAVTGENNERRSREGRDEKELTRTTSWSWRYRWRRGTSNEEPRERCRRTRSQRGWPECLQGLGRGSSRPRWQ